MFKDYEEISSVWLLPGKLIKNVTNDRLVDPLSRKTVLSFILNRIPKIVSKCLKSKESITRCHLVGCNAEIWNQCVKNIAFCLKGVKNAPRRNLLLNMPIDGHYISRLISMACLEPIKERKRNFILLIANALKSSHEKCLFGIKQGQCPMALNGNI